ncbi:hypothetical protein Tco_0452510 [Tanacetum coccineum]
MAGSEDDIPPPPPSQTPTQQTPYTVSTIKLPILKKGEYDIWAMKMEHYLAHTDYPIWEVIQRGNGPVSVSTDTNGLIKVLPPKTVEEILARERERKARTTLLMALPEINLEQLGDASIEIQAYTQALKKVEAQFVAFAHQQAKLCMRKRKDYPQRALQNKGIVNSGCSRHMTGNKAYLAEYQDFNGGLVAFGGSKGYITGKGKFDGKSDEGFLVGYSLRSKALRVYNLETKRVEETYTDLFRINQMVAGKAIRIRSVNLARGLLCTANMVFLYFNNQESQSKRIHSYKGSLPKILRNLVLQAGAAKASNDSEIPALEDSDEPSLQIGIFNHASYDDEGVRDKYVAEILKKFDFASVKTCITTIEELETSNKSLVKDEDGVDVDVHVYRSMIGSLMYLTASRPDIMFAVCACARFQVTPKASHLNAVKRIFRYLKHQPKLGLWYPRDSPFELEAFSDSDYGGASLDRKSTTGGCQFLGRRLISWQCKKQTIVANSTTEAEYVAAANCCGQVLWIQNQMMDYGFNFMNTKIHIDNESTISVIKNPVAHSRTKHIEIRFHFIRDCYEKRLIEVIKIHTDSNVADLLTKGFDVTRFNFLVVSIGLYLGSRESLERDMDGTAEFLLSNLFDFWLTKVSTDRLKVSTDRQSLYRYKAVRENTGRGLECNFGGFFAIEDATTINTHLNYTIDPS